MRTKALWYPVILSVALCLLMPGLATGIRYAVAGNRTVTVRYFWGEGCPHCAEAKPFLEKLKAKYPEMKIESYEVFKNRENLDRFERTAKAHGKEATGVPAFFIGNTMILGFSSETGREIEEKVRTCLQRGAAMAEAEPEDTNNRRMWR